MPASPPPPQTLPCKECGYANEPERVYCHNCGAKLDRSVLPKEEQLRREDPEKARKRIMRMANPASSLVKRELLALIKTLFLATFAACVIVGLKAPDNVPPEKSEMLARIISSDLMDLVNSPAPHSATFTEAEINAYLRNGKVQKTGWIPGVEFKRAYVNLEPGACRVVVEKSLWGYPMYMGSLYRVEGSSGVLTAVNTGGNIGRLAIHPLIMERAAPYLFQGLFDALKREFSQVQQMQTVTVRKGRVDVVCKGRH